MAQRRREFMRQVAGVAFAGTLSRESHAQGGPAVSRGRTYDVAVVGAGVFGAWTAHWLRQQGRSVALLDAHGPANSRASSGGESRIIRLGYGSDEIYTRWSLRSLQLWREFFERVGQPLFRPTGVLWINGENDRYAMTSQAILENLKVRYEKLLPAELARRFRQVRFAENEWGILEPDSGVLMARRAVQAVVEEAVRNGVNYWPEAVASPAGKGPLDSIRTASGQAIGARTFVFACGPWLPKVFPGLLEGRIRPTRQEVFFFGTPDASFAPPDMPAWIDFPHEVYGIPDLENRGFKIALDRHGPAFDPETGARIVTAEGLREVREHLGRRFPALRDAPVVESRVCQYENTSSGDFLIDRHPDYANVWLVGGGSGHGFKHGPALGEYVARLVTQGGETDARFSLATKDKTDARNVY
jgi:sarcosine oxidase